MSSRERIPIFPLSLVLFPQEALPLHIFEDRYKQMVRFCLSESVPFGVVGIDNDRMESLGCTARIRSIVGQFEDETFDIETVGETRFRIEDLSEDFPYLTAGLVPFEDRDEPVVATERERLVAQHMKLMELVGEPIRPSAYAEDHLLSFRIGSSAGLDFAQRQQFLEIDSEAVRITYLVNHLGEFIPRVQSIKERKNRIKSNGHFD